MVGRGLKVRLRYDLMRLRDTIRHRDEETYTTREMDFPGRDGCLYVYFQREWGVQLV